MNEWTSASRWIGSSLSQLVETVLDISAYPRWASQITHTQVMAVDDAGHPREARLTLDAGVLKDVMRLRYEVVRMPAAATVSWRLVDAGQLRSLHGRYEFATSGTGCDVTYRLSVDPGIPLVTALRRKAEERIVAVALDDLAREVERRATEIADT